MTVLQSRLFATGLDGSGCVLISGCSRVTPILRSYSTARIPVSARITYWNELHSDLISPLEFTPADRDRFEGSLRVDLLGPLAISWSFATPATIERNERHVARSSARLAFLMMPLRGEVLSQHYGREALLGEGDFTLYDSSAPGRLLLAGDNEALSISIPYRLLTLHIPDPDGLFGVRMAGAHGFGAAVNTLLRSVWQHVERGLPAELGPNVAKTVLDLLATCYALQSGTEATESSMARARRAQVKRHIESRLRDPDLNAVTIAEALNFSPRYVRMVFAAEGESVSAYILRRRLEECARQLGNRLWQGHSITETALHWGFTSVAHFTRAFKGRFGVTPSWYRRSGSAAGASEPMHER